MRRMFNSLNRLGLPAKYAVLYSAGAVIFLFIWNMVGAGTGEPMVYPIAVVLGAVWGAGKGYLRKKQGLTS